MRSRPFTPMMLTGVLAVALAFTLRGPLIGLPVEAPLIGASVATAWVVIALGLSYLAFGRSRVTGLLRDLALGYSLMLIAFADLILVAIPTVMGAGLGRTPQLGAAILLAAGLFAFASTDTEMTAEPANRAWLGFSVVVLTSASLLAAIGVLAGAIDDSPEAVAVLEVAAASGFALGAFGFARRGTYDDAPVLRWLAIGGTLATVAHLDYALFPATDLAWVSAGDVLRVGFYLALAAGAAKEIGMYWQDIARLAALEERRRIGRDLHDGLAQELAYIAVEADALGIDSADDRLRALAGAAQRALGESRRAITTFSTNGEEPFDAALAQTAEDVAHRFGIPLSFNLTEGIDLRGQEREDLLRIVREAVTNAGRHARADLIEINLTNGDELTVTIRDNGRGFDTSDEEISAGGFGLRSMRERAEAMGGELRVWSAWGAGTEITVKLP